jgi:hypothetical protein
MSRVRFSPPAPDFQANQSTRRRPAERVKGTEREISGAKRTVRDEKSRESPEPCSTDVRAHRMPCLFGKQDEQSSCASPSVRALVALRLDPRPLWSGRHALASFGPAPKVRSAAHPQKRNIAPRQKRHEVSTFAASSPFQQSVNPRWLHHNCFRALPLGSAELLRFGEIFRRVAKLFLAGLDCPPRFAVQLVDTRATSLQCAQIKIKYPCSTPVYLCHNRL